MNDLVFEKIINQPADQVWDAMLDPKGYAFWVKAFSSGSTFEGKWEEGATVRFVDPELGGTLAVLDRFRRPTSILARHIGMIDKDGTVDTESVMAGTWIGTIEEYEFVALDGGATRLVIRMKCEDQFVQMFNNSWPKALDLIAELCA